jgi:tetratricopeptide (TPR) repeat protein
MGPPGGRGLHGGERVGSSTESDVYARSDETIWQCVSNARRCRMSPICSRVMNSPPSSLDMAFALLREGRAVDAQELMVREAKAVEARHGRGSPEWASAQCDLGHILLNCDQMDQAAQCYRDACSGPPPSDPEAYKDRLTYRLNIGMALRLAGRLDEAEAELRLNVQERLGFYGREHPGYAFGLESLADVLLRAGKMSEAREAIEETVGNFWRNGHEKIADALAVRAEIMKAGGMDGSSFTCLEALPDEIIAGMAATVLNRIEFGDPKVGMAVLRDLAATLETRLGPDHQATLNTWSVLANLGRDTGDQSGRVDAISRVLASYDRQGRTEEAVSAVLGLALALGDTGDRDGALRAYQDAAARAHGIGRPELDAEVLRNWGLALADAERTAEAEQRLREAVAHAQRGADHELLGRTHIALGLFLQHNERLGEAQQIVQDGLAVMDPTHPDAIVGRSHLGAIQRGQSCGCGAIGDTLSAAFRDFVMARLPANLLSDLDVSIVDGEFKIEVQLQREPTPDEIDHLNRVMNSATAEFRRRVTS